MTSDANAKLPIPTYALVDEPCGDEWRTELLEQAGGDLCKADDVRGLVDEICKIIAGSGVIDGDADEADAVGYVRTMVVACCEARNNNAALMETLKRAEAQRDRLAEVLRLALELAEDQDDNLGSWCEVWEQAAQALADIDEDTP